MPLPALKIIILSTAMMRNAVLLLFLFCFSCTGSTPVDRYSLVTRHNITHSAKDSLSSLSVGNGEFAFTVDITGLQTFPEAYEKGIPLGTMSNWGWHTAGNPENFSLADVYKPYDVHGRTVEYVRQFRPAEGKHKAAASEWLRENPRRIHLGLVGLQIIKVDGTEISLSDIDEPVQNLDLWTGEIESRFNVEGVPVTVFTVCHPDYDMISVKIISELIKKDQLKIKLRFPFGAPVSFGSRINAQGLHSTEIKSDTTYFTLFERKQGSDSYKVLLLKNNAVVREAGEHTFEVDPSGSDPVYSFSCHFFSEGNGRVQSFNETESASMKSWEEFWSGGGAVDFSGVEDPRAKEIERRVVLSRYLTRIQCSGSLPAAETGLTYNSWYGKFHLEMHWWHAVHFALWQKEKVLEKQMQYYSVIFENARKTAERQGYQGVRWPKMVGPDGRESPSTVGTYLIWQQPHVIFFAEMLYQNSGNKQEVLGKYKDLVFSTADFMASYAWYDSVNDKYCLGPVLIPAQESLSLTTTVNPSFELVYWHWGLKTAIAWKERLGEEPDQRWRDVTEKIAGLPVQDGIYLCSEDTKDSYTNPRYMSDHPIVSGVLGVMPDTRLVDKEILARSLDTIASKWNWRSTWGWDFPMLGMAAAAAGRPEQAIDFLLMDAPKNRYLVNGHNYQDARLPVYLPGNGGLLAAVAKMCVMDQFPGGWKVKWENLNKYPE